MEKKELGKNSEAVLSLEDQREPGLLSSSLNDLNTRWNKTKNQKS